MEFKSMHFSRLKNTSHQLWLKQRDRPKLETQTKFRYQIMPITMRTYTDCREHNVGGGEVFADEK